MKYIELLNSRWEAQAQIYFILNKLNLFNILNNEIPVVQGGEFNNQKNIFFAKGPRIKFIKIFNSQGLNSTYQKNLTNMLILIYSILNRSEFQEPVRNSIIKYRLIFSKGPQIKSIKLCNSQGLNSIYQKNLKSANGPRCLVQFVGIAI